MVLHTSCGCDLFSETTKCRSKSVSSRSLCAYAGAMNTFFVGGVAVCRFVVRVRFASNALRCFFVTGLRSTTTDADDTDADANADAAAAAAVEGADGLSQSATEARSAAAVGMSSVSPCA